MLRAQLAAVYVEHELRLPGPDQISWSTINCSFDPLHVMHSCTMPVLSQSLVPSSCRCRAGKYGTAFLEAPGTQWKHLAEHRRRTGNGRRIKLKVGSFAVVCVSGGDHGPAIMHTRHQLLCTRLVVWFDRSVQRHAPCPHAQQSAPCRFDTLLNPPAVQHPAWRVSMSLIT